LEKLIMTAFATEVKKGQRFEFGKNWKSFLTRLNDDRILIAEKAIADMLKVPDLRGKRAIDIGSGSGLFSLAMHNLGADVVSFDYDPNSVACTRELKSRYFPQDPSWTVQEGSALDREFLDGLGSFDLVYSWGVLHHTGSMWPALDNAASMVKPGGSLFIALYNDQGYKSRIWTAVKRTYCSGPLGKAFISAIYVPYFFALAVLECIVRRENIFSTYAKNRGMSLTHDWYDWLGGYPFEVASVEAVFKFFYARGFELTNLQTVAGGLGNNHFVFVKKD
jgi:2-polyprenyl-3-methyl-5-hydroxy-6-metoxy-1,4-benzoquinol methylase